MKLTKKLLGALMAMALVLPLFVFSAEAKKVTVRADGFNSSRGSGQLIIYTPAMGATTQTNEWGFEAVIKDNRCIKVGGGDNEIPDDGFVVSGHNEDAGGKQMGKWIEDNISVGDYVYYSADGVVTVSDKKQDVSAYYELTATINGVNITRNENFLVIYNNRGRTTGTNQWGYEAVVTAGFITSIGGNDNLVPSQDGSFVISAHGTMVQWLQDNAKLGLKASYDASEKTLKLIYDESAALAGVETQFSDLSALYDSALEEYLFFDRDGVKEKINSIENAIAETKKSYQKSKDSAALAESTSAIEADISEAKQLISETRPVEYRAVWLRPTQTSAQEVDDYVETLYKTGINALCIETLYDCTMIMPMPSDSLFEVNPKFAHFDMLKAYIDSCHKRGMELHCWLPIFYVGNSGSSNAFRSPGMKKPEWLSISNDGKTYQNDDNFMMLDPGNEEVQDFLLANYKYILETYDIDGFQLDYIRYYARSATRDYGYNQATLDAFKEKYGVTPKYDMNASYWNDWVEFRCANVTRFVSRTRKLIDEVAPDVLLGADVAADPSDGKNNIYQDYFTWLDNGWLDIVFPMAYGLGYEKAIASQVAHCGENAFNAVGLGIFMAELDPAIMFDQINYGHTAATDGATFFEASAYLRKETGDYLQNSVYAEPAITPNLDRLKAARTLADFAVSRVETVIVPLGGMNKADGEAVVNAIKAFADTFGDKTANMELYKDAISAIDASGAKDNAKSAIKRDLLPIAKIYNVAGKSLDLGDLPDNPEDLGNSSQAEESTTPAESADSNESENLGDDSNGENPGDGNNNKAGIIIAVVAVAVAIGAVAASVIYKKKKTQKK